MAANTRASGAGERLHDLQYIEIGKIAPSPKNPRLEFPQAEIDQLMESIDQKGVLVPVVVAKLPKKEKGKEYVLVDGERRFRCARDLGLDNIPAVITSPQDDEATLVDMFNIHLVREEWRDMPTAWALERVMELRKKRGAPIGDVDLQSATGLSVERIKRLRHALSLPKPWQQLIREGKIPLNFFWELHVNVIEPLGKHRPELLKSLDGETIQAALVQKRLGEVITDSVALRKVRQIIVAAAKDAEGNKDGKSVLDRTIQKLVKDGDFTVEEAYEESVELIVELDRLQRKCDNMVQAFAHLMEKIDGADRAKVLAIGRKLIKELTDELRQP